MAEKFRHSIILFIAAIIWGIAFVSQSVGGDYVGPYTFTCIRSFIGVIVLLPVIAFMDKTSPSVNKPVTREERRTLWKAGASCGAALMAATTAQQLALYYGSSTGKAGFLTACYILLVPILGLFFHKKVHLQLWIGVALALVGLYFLCIKDGFTFERTDLLLLAAALLFSIQITLIGHYSPKVDGVRLSWVQFVVCGGLSMIPMVVVDVSPSVTQWAMALTTWKAWIPLLYAGVLSNGVAYTFQIIGQRGLNATLASMIMSMEAVFSVLAGWLILHEHLSDRELIGCLVMFLAIIVAQLPEKTVKA